MIILSNMPGRGTPKITVRVDPGLWERFREAAGDQDRAAVLRAFIRWYVGERDAEMPERPEGTRPNG